MRFNETVGTVLTIISAMPLIHTALRYGERAIQSAPFEADEHRHHHEPGAGRGRRAAEEIGRPSGGGSAASWVLKRASRNAQHTA